MWCNSPHIQTDDIVTILYICSYTHTPTEALTSNQKVRLAETSLLGLLTSFHWPGAIHKIGSPVGPAHGLLCLSTCHLTHEFPWRSTSPGMLPWGALTGHLFTGRHLSVGWKSIAGDVSCLMCGDTGPGAPRFVPKPFFHQRVLVSMVAQVWGTGMSLCVITWQLATKLLIVL